MSRVQQRVTFAVLASISAAACGLPLDDRVQPYDDVPFDLGGTTTTVIVEDTTTTSVADPEVTTTTIVRTVPVDIAYVLGGGGLQRVTLELPAPVSNRLLIERLESPPSDGGTLLRTEVERGLVTSFSIDRGVATVSLGRGVLQRLGSLQQRRAIAQIVLTLTLFTTEQGGIGQVGFVVDTTPLSVFVPSRGSNSEPGEPLAYADFAVLLADSDGTVTTTAPSTTPPTVPTTSTTTSADEPDVPDGSTTTTAPPTAAASTSQPPLPTSTTVAG
ncbi:MAG: Sporulation and spore germination [Actinomycetota bacterium]|jgi:hypothetical protein